MEKITRSEDQVMKWVATTSGYQRLLASTKRCTSIKGHHITTKDVCQVVLRDQLLASCDGKGLCHQGETLCANACVTDGTLLLNGGDYIQAIKVRRNLLPTMERTTRGRRNGNPLCDAGCNATESLGHISQSCVRTHRLRTDRHNAVVQFVWKKCEGNQLEVLVDPHIQTRLGIRIPDLIIYDTNTVYVVDVAICADWFSLKKPYDAKLLYYHQEDIVNWVTTNFPDRGIVFEAVVLNWRGAIFHRSTKAMKSWGLTNRDLKLMAVKVLTYTANLYKHFSRSTTWTV